MMPTRVSIVGAGPGDPELLTVRAVHRLQQADYVFYDGLVPDAIVDVAAHARRLPVSRREDADRFSPEVVSALVVQAAQSGARVVRLRAGDPFVFARGAEEALALVEAGVPFEIVPGLSSALAAPALAGIPVTHRGLTSGFLVVSGHAPQAYASVIDALPPASVTVVVLMGLGQRAAIVERLLSRGWSAETPTAIVTSAGQLAQARWRGTLGALGQADLATGRSAPGVIVIGDVVSLADVLGDGRENVGHQTGEEEQVWHR